MIDQLRVLLLLHYCRADKMRLPRGWEGGGGETRRVSEWEKTRERRVVEPPLSPLLTADPFAGSDTRPIGRYDARRDMAAALSYY